MDKFNLLNFPNPDELANAVAQKWLAQLSARTSSAPNYCVAFSGGRIAKTFSAAVTKIATEKRISFPSVHFFWADECCVPPTAPESNFAIAQQLIFSPLGIPQNQIHRIHGEDEPSRAAANASDELTRLAPKSADNQPIFDMIFLGLGENGHIASLFPEESEAERQNKAVYRPVVATKPPPRRITLGYFAIAAAREVWMLASGSGKEDALRESLKPDGQTPFARVLKMRTQTLIFSDIRI